MASRHLRKVSRGPIRLSADLAAAVWRIDPPITGRNFAQERGPGRSESTGAAGAAPLGGSDEWRISPYRSYGANVHADSRRYRRVRIPVPHLDSAIGAKIDDRASRRDIIGGIPPHCYTVDRLMVRNVCLAEVAAHGRGKARRPARRDPMRAAWSLTPWPRLPASASPGGLNRYRISVSVAHSIGPLGAAS
jgi:hypothetical protein